MPTDHPSPQPMSDPSLSEQIVRKLRATCRELRTQLAAADDVIVAGRSAVRCAFPHGNLEIAQLDSLRSAIRFYDSNAWKEEDSHD